MVGGSPRVADVRELVGGSCGLGQGGAGTGLWGQQEGLPPSLEPHSCSPLPQLGHPFHYDALPHLQPWTGLLKPGAKINIFSSELFLLGILVTVKKS